MPFILYKKFIVQKIKSTYGPRSWGIPPYLAASLAPAPEYVCFFFPEGRFVMVDIKLESNILTLVNILIYLTETIAHYVMHIYCKI